MYIRIRGLDKHTPSVIVLSPQMGKQIFTSATADEALLGQYEIKSGLYSDIDFTLSSIHGSGSINKEFIFITELLVMYYLWEKSKKFPELTFIFSKIYSVKKLFPVLDHNKDWATLHNGIFSSTTHIELFNRLEKAHFKTLKEQVTFVTTYLLNRKFIITPKTENAPHDLKSSVKKKYTFFKQAKI